MNRDERKVKRLIVRRNTITGSINLVKTFYENFNSERDFPQLRFRLEKLDELYREFNEIQSEIEAEEELPEEFSETRANVENDYFMLKGNLAAKLDAIAPNNSSQSPLAPPAHVSSVRLPEIKIPEFSGNFDEWMNFHDLFTTLIHVNLQLSSIQKFQYLKAVLKGEALRLIESLEVSATNYTIAWDLLNKRYDNRNLQIKQHFSALLSTPSVRKESSSALANLVDEFGKHVSVLNKLEDPKDHWNSFLVETLSSKLDPVSQKEWENQLCDDIRPTYESLVTFIQKRSRILQSLMLSQPSLPSAKFESKIESKSSRNKISIYHSANSDLPKCILCKQAHLLMQCDEFKRQTPQKRFEIAKRHGLCLNCLKSSHLMKNCTSGSCRTCNRKHHTLLHLNSFKPSSIHDDEQHTIAAQIAQSYSHSQSAPVVDSSSSVTCIADQCHVLPRVQGVPSSSVGPSKHSSSFVPSSDGHPSGSAQNTTHVTNCHTQSFFSKPSQSAVFMLTAYVKVKDLAGNFLHARALLDCASEANFVSEHLAQQLRLKRTPANVDVYGISQSVQRVKDQVPITIASRSGNFITSMEFFVLPALTRVLPSTNVDISKWVIPRNLPLADPKFNIAHDVDLIIGIKSFFSILENDQISLGQGFPILRKTVFGYVVAGETNSQPKSPAVVCNVSSIDNLDSTIRKFWEVESFEKGKSLSLEEDGRYVVRLPIREEMLHALGESFPIANRRFLSTERKLGSNDNLRADYFEFMTEYENLGHMEPVKPDLTKPHYYLPHHAIQRPESTTTKTRVVFDASCRAANNISLNDICYIGPTVQPSLISTLINFRLPKYAVTADVEKMYRQIVVHLADRPLQQILWRKNPEAPLQTFRLNTVTYGTAPAPYLATRVLNQLAHDEAENFPLAAPLIPKRFYVDDYLSGNDDKQLLIAENHQMIELLKSGGFTLRKWCSNCNEVLSQIPEALRDSRSELDIGQSGSIKTLGLRWHPQPDHFTFNVPDLETSASITKRVILSEMSRLFDPMGLLGASVVSAKIFLQSLWSEKFSWNDPLPVHHQAWWQQYRQEMESFRSLAIPRQVFMNDYDNFELHCFSDASDSAYGCCIYVLSSNEENKPICNLLASKSRVSPLNKLSTPRLELCAALLAAQLQDSIVEYTGWNCPVTFWTDSTIVLHWLASSSSVWKVFVSNRIAEIHRITRGSPWRHIPTDLNPADRISRGVSPSALIADNLWWHGPNFLCTDKSNWPPNDISLSPLHMQARGIESKQSTIILVSPPFSEKLHGVIALYKIVEQNLINEILAH
ncbi:uncharacterized protein LOC129753335 [Uranotaenia lowii]|uniref:uncharacterized protein LOC129753335 n=1 Tax=Uranotaenia lowii TaxID=190385 RepID=UPI002478F604|nr:uncharacterized protein LOC129753335 [Uranotaenia lowii]